jgi:hypothetical protein
MRINHHRPDSIFSENQQTCGLAVNRCVSPVRFISVCVDPPARRGGGCNPNEEPPAPLFAALICYYMLDVQGPKNYSTATSSTLCRRPGYALVTVNNRVSQDLSRRTSDTTVIPMDLLAQSEAQNYRKRARCIYHNDAPRLYQFHCH